MTHTHTHIKMMRWGPAMHETRRSGVSVEGMTVGVTPPRSPLESEALSEPWFPAEVTLSPVEVTLSWPDPS